MSTTGATPSEGARQVREEDAFDVEAVAAWLREHAEPEPACRARRGAGGAAVLRWRLEPHLPAPLPGGRDLILRRAPRGTKAKGAHDMGREYRIQRQLKPVFPYVAGDGRLLRRRRGGRRRLLRHGAARRRRAARRPAGRRADRRTRRGQLCLNMIDVLVELHSVDPEAAGLGVARQGAGLRPPSGRGLVGPVPQRAHRRRSRLRGRHGVARRAPARRRRATA